MSPEAPRERHTVQSLRAVAHPTRVAILRALAGGTSANVRTIAEHIGEPANSVSFHLRQLEKYHYVVRAEAPETATKRESWWKVNEGRSEIKLEDFDGSPEAAEAIDVMRSMLQMMYTQRAEDISQAAYRAHEALNSPADPDFFVGNFVDVAYLSPSDAEELANDIRHLIAARKKRSTPQAEGGFEYSICFDLFPHFTGREL